MRSVLLKVDLPEMPGRRGMGEDGATWRLVVLGPDDAGREPPWVVQLEPPHEDDDDLYGTDAMRFDGLKFFMAAAAGVDLLDALTAGASTEPGTSPARPEDGRSG